MISPVRPGGLLPRPGAGLYAAFNARTQWVKAPGEREP